MQFTLADSLGTARAKKYGKYAAIGAAGVVAVPVVVAGGALVLAGGLIAAPFLWDCEGGEEVEGRLNNNMVNMSSLVLLVLWAVPVVVGGGALVLAGGLIAAPFYGIAKGVKKLRED